MACSKYSIINTGSTIVTFNYRRCDDAMWEYQVEITPGETKNIWLISDTFSISSSFNQQISVDNQGVFPPITPGPTPTPIPSNDLSDLIIPNDDVTYIIL
jgi:hypothetical protein